MKAKEAAKLKKGKEVEDKKKFVDFLKKAGYNAKHLGPMKIENLLELYEFEKKRQETIEEQIRYER